MTDDRRQQEYWEAEHGHRAPDHPVVQAFAQQRLAVMRDLVDLSTVRTALDVGCGNGFSTVALEAAVPRVWASDRSRYMLARHPSRGAGRLAVADTLALPYRSASFDLVCGWEMLHHIAEPERALAEMARVSRRWVVVAEPNPINPAQCAFALYDRDHRWVLRYSRRYLQRIFGAAGLDVRSILRGGWILPNVTPPALLRVLRRLPYGFPLGITTWVAAVKADAPTPAAPG